MAQSGFNCAFTSLTLCGLPDAAAERLPTTSTGFNKIYLSRYRNADELRGRRSIAMLCSSGFAEATKS